jgi:hypothetical protein
MSETDILQEESDMRAMLLGSALLAAVATSAAPAGAQGWTSAGISSGSAFAGSSSGVTPRREGSGHAIGTFDGGRHDRRDRRRNRDRDGGIVFGDWDRDYQGDTLWRPNSFNDWWHERPNRSFPRWMKHNQNCERQWWGGGTWRC